MERCIECTRLALFLSSSLMHSIMYLFLSIILSHIGISLLGFYSELAYIINKPNKTIGVFRHTNYRGEIITQIRNKEIRKRCNKTLPNKSFTNNLRPIHVNLRSKKLKINKRELCVNGT